MLNIEFESETREMNRKGAWQQFQLHKLNFSEPWPLEITNVLQNYADIHINNKNLQQQKHH